MAIRLPPAFLLCFLLGSGSLQASGYFHTTMFDLTVDNYYAVSDILSNPYEVFLSPEKHLIASKVDDAGRQKKLTSEQRKQLKERRKRFESLSPEAKKKLKDARKKFKRLPPEERKRLKKKWRDLPPEERNKIIQKKRENKG